MHALESVVIMELWTGKKMYRMMILKTMISELCGEAGYNCLVVRRNWFINNV